MKNNGPNIILTGIIGFNVILSAILIITGSVFHVYINTYADLVEENFNIASSMTIAVGVTVLVSCWIIFRFNQENMTPAIIMSSIFILSLYVSLLVVGIYEYSKVQRQEMKPTYIQQVEKIFTLAHLEHSTDVIDTFYSVQASFKCCGVSGAQDYHNSSYMPASCCYECICPDKLCTDVENAWLDGCGTALYDLIIKNVGGIATTAITLATLGIASTTAIPIIVLTPLNINI